MAKIDAMVDAREEGKTFTAFDRAEYKKLTSAQRKLADEYYVERYGKGVLEMQEEEPNKNHFKIGKLMGRLLSRMYQ